MSDHIDEARERAARMREAIAKIEPFLEAGGAINGKEALSLCLALSWLSGELNAFVAGTIATMPDLAADVSEHMLMAFDQGREETQVAGFQEHIK